jgi:hypothetical protein
MHTNTKSKNQLANLENSIYSDNNNNNNNNSSDDSILKAVNIALVAPTFTAAAYDHNSFYTFYKLYSNTPPGTNVTNNLNLLSRKITNHDILRASLLRGGKI